MMLAPADLQSPEALLKAARDLGPRIRELAPAIRAERRIPEALLRELKAAGVFRLMMPRAWGGPEADPLTLIRVVEELSYADASVGWIAMVGSSGGFYSAFLEEQVGRRLYSDLDQVTSGVVAPCGRGRCVDGGYVISGRWPFASASVHSDWMVGGFVICDGDEPRLDDDGQPVTAIALLPAQSCEVIDTWHSLGLAGSATNDLVVNEVFVPAEHTFDPLNGPILRPGPLYAFRGIDFCKAMGVFLGIGRGALDALVEYANRVRPGVAPLKHDPLLQEQLARMEATLGAARSFAWDVVGDLWRTLQAGDELSDRQRGMYRLAITHSAEAAREVARMAFEAAGSGSVFAANPFEQKLRDVQTAAQHHVVLRKSYVEIGRRLLGLQPRLPLF